MSWRNERSVEIPIVLKTVSETSSGKILEVGNVLSHYFNFPHDIVDKYETANGLINQDIVDFQAEKKYDLIVSISTLEHVGWDEEIRDPAKILRAIENLKNCLAPGGKLIVTLPLGLNRYLDELLRNGKINFTIQGLLKRISKGNDWVETDWPTSEKMKYGCPFLWANALFVGIYQKSASTTRI
jgi:SAM-dependent methyltransferase